MNQELINLLEELEVRGNDQKVYLAALELGPSTITDLARKAQVERATVYAILERLKERGLVTHPIKDYGRDIQVESPEKLLILANRKKEKILEEENNFKAILPDLLASVNQRGKKPKVRFYEGKEQFITLYTSILDEAKDNIFYLGDANILINLVSYQFEKEWIKKRVRKNIHIDILVHKSDLTEDFVKSDRIEERITKFLPGDFQFEASFMVYSNKVILFNPVVPLAIEISDETIAKMFLAIFKGLWGKR